MRRTAAPCCSRAQAASQAGQEEPKNGVGFPRHTRGRNLTVFVRRCLPQKNGCPGGNLAISARRTLRVLNGFREMVGTTLLGVPPTPLPLLGSVYVDQATVVFVRRSGRDGDHPGLLAPPGVPCRFFDGRAVNVLGGGVGHPLGLDQAV